MNNVPSPTAFVRAALLAALVMASGFWAAPALAEGDLAFCLTDQCDFSKGVRAAMPCVTKCVDAFPLPPQSRNAFYQCLTRCDQDSGPNFAQGCAEMCVQSAAGTGF